VIVSTHLLAEVTLICDDILIINRGKKMFYDSLRNIGKTTDLEQLFLRYTYGFSEEKES
jgi:ABC-type multidrug transport system ATPase subunit